MCEVPPDLSAGPGVGLATTKPKGARPPDIDCRLPGHPAFGRVRGARLANPSVDESHPRLGKRVMRGRGVAAPAGCRGHEGPATGSSGAICPMQQPQLG